MESNKDNQHFKHSQLSRQEIANTNTQSQRVISSLSPSICPCHTYKELVQQIHQLPLTSQRDPPLLCSALCASWFRPAVAALAASGADPPHFNASDIYLGRTTGGRGGGGREGRRRERLCAAPVDVDSPAMDFTHPPSSPHPSLLPSTSTLSYVLYFAVETTCSGCLCHLRESEIGRA